MPFDTIVLSYQLLTLLAGVGAQAFLLAVHSFAPSPLGARFLRFSVPFTLFYLLIGVAAYVFRSPGFDLVSLELLGTTVFFGLYVAMVSPWTAFLLELVQRPYRGIWRTLAGLLSTLGVLVPLVLWGLPLAPVERLERFRLVLQAGYLPLLLGFLAAQVSLVWIKSGHLKDPWKRATARGLVVSLALGFPLFVLDGLWPWLQVQGGWVPRAFNFHGLFFVGLHLFIAYRWTLLVRDLRRPAPPAPVRQMDREKRRTWGLTFREEEVLDQVFVGRANRDIAEALGLTLGTVKNHVYKIFQKSGASSRKELVEMLEFQGPGAPSRVELFPGGNSSSALGFLHGNPMDEK